MLRTQSSHYMKRHLTCTFQARPQKPGALHRQFSNMHLRTHAETLPENRLAASPEAARQPLGRPRHLERRFENNLIIWGLFSNFLSGCRGGDAPWASPRAAAAGSAAGAGSATGAGASGTTTSPKKAGVAVRVGVFACGVRTKSSRSSRRQGGRRLLAQRALLTASLRALAVVSISGRHSQQQQPLPKCNNTYYGCSG